MHPRVLFPIILAVIAIWSTPLLAQTVAVHSGDQNGHGFLVREGTVCYLVLPKHVAAGRRNVTVFSAAPVVHSSALIETPFWDGMDLAIGIVRGEVEDRCVRRLSELDATAQPETGANVQMLRLRQSGEPERIPMRITDSQYLTLDAEIADGKSELFKGTSGAFLFAGETPVGMAIETVSPTEGRFIRIEEIFQNVERRVKRRSGFAKVELQSQTPEPTVDDGVPFDFVSATLPPIDPDYSEANLAGPGSYVFSLTRPNRLAFKARGGTAATVSQIQLRSEQNEAFGIPRNILVELSNTEDGLRTRIPTTVEMGPDGILNVTLQQKTRWVFITIRSAWDGTTIGLDNIYFR